MTQKAMISRQIYYIAVKWRFSQMILVGSEASMKTIGSPRTVKSP